MKQIIKLNLHLNINLRGLRSEVSKDQVVFNKSLMKIYKVI